MTFQAQAATETSITSYGSGARKIIRGYHVVSGAGLVRRFMQGGAQKWTPELDAALKANAEDWATVLNERVVA
jgi:hypothetical protein